MLGSLQLGGAERGSSTMEVLDGLRAELERGGTNDLEEALKNKLVKPVDRIGRDGFTLAHWACYFGATEALQKLLFHDNSVITTVEKHGWTPAHLSAIHGQQNCLQLLQQYGANMEAKDSRGYNVGHLASAHGNTYSLKLILENGYKIDSKDSRNWTTVHHAAFHGRYGALQLLAKWSANLMAVDEDGNIAAHLAASEGHIECLRLLVYYKKNPLPVLTAHNDKGATPKDMAIRFQRQGCADFLASAAREAEIDNDSEEDTEKGHGAFQAATKGNLQLLSMLVLEGHCNINQRDARGSTLAHKASGNGHIKCLQWLIDHGADLSLKNNLGETPLDVARKYVKTDCIALLGGGMGFETEEGIEQSPEALERAQEEVDKLTDALLIAKKHFQALGGVVENEMEEKLKETKEHFNRVVTDLKGQLEAEKEKRESLEKELDQVRCQLFQTKESLTKYQSQVAAQEADNQSITTPTLNQSPVKGNRRRNQSSKDKETGGAYFRLNRK